jgi:membrane fusion protein, multidrug efflux system
MGLDSMKTIPAFAVAITLLSLTGCNADRKPKEEQVKHLATTPISIDTTLVKEYVCQIRSIRHIELRALQRGYLQTVYIDEGQLVKKGQLLFQIMPNVYKAELQKAKADADFASIEYQNTLTLANKKIVAPKELAMSKAKLEGANADLYMAETNLQFTQLKAPFNGIIDRFHVRQGSLLNEGDLITNLADNSTMWVYFNVPEAEYLEYMRTHRPDSPLKVRLRMANNQEFNHIGVVETIEADFDSETGNIPFRATFANPEGLLRYGETGSVLITVPLKKAIIIPQKATFEILDKKYVFVIDAKNRVHSRQITVSAEMPDLFVVSEGLNVKEKIVLEGIRKVKDGEKIKYDFETPRHVMANLKLYSE